MANDSAGLSQADFRRLLQTPGRGGGDGQPSTDSDANEQQSKPALKSTGSAAVLGGGRLYRSHMRATPTEEVAVAAGSSSLGHGKPRGRSSGLRRAKAETGGGDRVLKYRDRAAERRKGLNKDYEDSERLLTQLHDGTTAAPPPPPPPPPPQDPLLGGDRSEGTSGGMSVDQRVAYEQSKYLGGDTEHTHLVKGLDFLLLEKMRSSQAASGGDQGDMDGEADLDEELERLQEERAATTDRAAAQSDGAGITDGDVASASTQLGRRVLETVRKIHKTKEEIQIALQSGFKADLNELFLPGRMYFEFNTQPGARGSATVTTTARIRSQDEVKEMFGSAAVESGSSTKCEADDRVVLSRVIASIAAARNRRQKSTAEAKARRQAETPAPEPLKVVELDAAPGLQLHQSDDAKPSLRVDDDDDDDIFADAGTDYRVTVAPKAPEDASAMVGPAVAESDSALVGPYPGGHDAGLSDEDESSGLVGPYPMDDGAYASDGAAGGDVVGPYPASDFDEEDAVTGAYPASGPESEGEGAAEDFPSRASGAKRRRMNQAGDGYDYGVEFGPDTMNAGELSGSSDSGDNDEDGSDMRLFSMAKSRFKAETRDLLQSRQQNRSAARSHSDAASSGKGREKAAFNSEWQKTRKIMQAKYGIDIAEDGAHGASSASAKPPGHKHKKARP
ncbi:hypothetical protein GQ54DRAFT_298492 [Martensiomyces pterosporus]|nr:hypothetical protein GQ54DRAFT_298492 [Martensiomyces pterosporus]